MREVRLDLGSDIVREGVALSSAVEKSPPRYTIFGVSNGDKQTFVL
jgi:hypothetical protein